MKNGPGQMQESGIQGPHDQCPTQVVSHGSSSNFGDKSSYGGNDTFLVMEGVCTGYKGSKTCNENFPACC